jgi:DNA gyrase/topoisomerase IV subunit A
MCWRVAVFLNYAYLCMYCMLRACAGIADLRDESDRDGIRMVIELKRDAIPQV